MERPKVSVIIPLYNTEEYIGETLDSIRNQTLREIEIIVVNDGSTDRSREIVAAIASDDQRITLLDQQNQGQSVARNNGIDNAHGEYIYFMDSDDLLDLDTLERCYTKCKEENLDFVMFDADSFGLEGYFNKDYYRRTHLIEDRVYNGLELMNMLMDKQALRIPLWLNVISYKFLLKTGLRLYPIKSYEDELFSALMFINADRAGMIPAAFFKRRLRHNSIMTTKFTKAHMENYFTVAEELTKFSKGKSKKIRSALNKFLGNMLNAAVWRAHKLPLKDKIWCVRVIAAHYLRYIKIKNIGVLMFKQ